VLPRNCIVVSAVLRERLIFRGEGYSIAMTALQRAVCVVVVI
jgi:hypothetical protein